MKTGFFTAFLTATCLFPTAFAYETDIRANAQEIYEASVEALEGYGIENADPASKTIKTKWVTDFTDRKKSVFGFKSTKRYERKHRMEIKISEGERFTHVSVDSEFLFRPADGSIQTPWRPLKTTRDDERLEKEVFHRILAQAEYARTRSAP